jgi:hypothetical protein
MIFLLGFDQVLDRAVEDVTKLDDLGDRFESHVALFPGFDGAFGNLQGEGHLALLEATGFAAGFDVGDVGDFGVIGGSGNYFHQRFDGAIEEFAEGDDPLEMGDPRPSAFPVLDAGFGHFEGDRQFALGHPGNFTLGCNIGNVDELGGFGGHDCRDGSGG